MALWMTTPAFLASATTIGLPIRHKRWMDWRVRIRRISSEASGTYGTANGLAAVLTHFFLSPLGRMDLTFSTGRTQKDAPVFTCLFVFLGGGTATYPISFISYP